MTLRAHAGNESDSMSDEHATGLLTFDSQDLHRLPVTALLYLDDDTILSGEGHLLCVNSYRGDFRTRQASFTIFPSQSIHGIEVVNRPGDGSNFSATQLMIYGGRLLRFVQIVQDKQGIWQTQLTPLLEIDDWILDGAVKLATSSSRPPTIALITAHNALWLLRSNPYPSVHGQMSWTLEQQVKGSNTILYSAHALWTDEDQILIASGTAFGDVILWSCNPTGDHPVQETVHYSYSAHEGSIFGIRISSIIRDDVHPEYTRWLASSSDDRTIRIWDISSLPHNVSSLTEHTRGTGFGTRDFSETNRPPLVSKVMGHLSRIWHVRFLQDQEHGAAVRSFGEDATSITWRLDPSQSTPGMIFSMSPLHTAQTHSGKNIWSVAEYKDGQIATGGADGAIALVPSSPHLQQFPIPLINSISDTHPRTKDFYKSYTFLDDHHLFTVSQQGCAQIIRLLNGLIEVVQSFNQPELANHSMVASTSALVFACGSHGDVFAYCKDDANQHIVSRGSGKVTGLLAFGTPTSAHKDDPAEPATHVIALLRSAVNGPVQLIILVNRSGSSTCQVLHDIAVGSPSGFVLTSLLCTVLTADKLSAIVGSRSGHIASIEATKEDLTSGNAVIQNVSTIHQDAITSLNWQASRTTDCAAQTGYLFTTSRDGSHAVFHVRQTATKDAHSLVRVHQLHLPFGPNIEGLGIIDNEELLIWGFRNKHFVVYSVTRHVEIMAVDCGGVHRSWTFRPSIIGGTFVWTKASEVFAVEQKAPRFNLINAGGHGREIKAIATTGLSPDMTILATGAEDTCIRLFSFSDRQPDIRCLAVLRKHNTGPQQISFSTCGQYMFSSGGFEEFNVWKLEQNCPLVGLGVYCENTHPRSGKSDLRITSFVVDEVVGRNNAAQDKTWKVYMTYSDSRVALWLLENQAWQQVIEADYLTACPTGIFNFYEDVITSTLLTTATDGHLALWKHDTAADHASQSLSWYARHKVHQSAILAATSSHLPDGSTVLITGGDDNAITFTRLSADLSSVDSSIVAKAHAAAVTALLIVNTREHAQLATKTLLSVGLDQRLIVWDITIDCSTKGVSHLCLQKQRVLNISVADACGIEILPLKAHANGQQTVKVVVAGIGMQVLTMSGS